MYGWRARACRRWERQSTCASCADNAWISVGNKQLYRAPALGKCTLELNSKAWTNQLNFIRYNEPSRTNCCTFARRFFFIYIFSLASFVDEMKKLTSGLATVTGTAFLFYLFLSVSSFSLRFSQHPVHTTRFRNGFAIQNCVCVSYM